MSLSSEKDQEKYEENLPTDGNRHPQIQEGFTSDLDNLPKGYYRSPFFVGTLFAIGTGLAASTGGYGLASPNLTLINNDIGMFPCHLRECKAIKLTDSIGPDANINWVSFVYTLTLSVGLLIFGRLTDVFGFVQHRNHGFICSINTKFV